jgi:hypothetical protein
LAVDFDKGNMASGNGLTVSEQVVIYVRTLGARASYDRGFVGGLKTTASHVLTAVYLMQFPD